MTGRYEVKSPDTKGQRLIDSSKVPERENPDQTRPVNADADQVPATDRTLLSK